MDIEFPDLPLLRLNFRLRAEDSAALPPFLGSTLRGAFGGALKRVFCFVPHETTENCWFAEACPYQYIFESRNLGNIPADELHTFLKGQKEFPHPFVLLPPAPVRRRPDPGDQNPSHQKNFNDDFRSNHFSRGETLDFSILLIGKAVRHWPHVVVAVRLLSEIGLGEERSRVPFSLVRATTHDGADRSVEVFNESDRHLSAHRAAPVKLARIVDLSAGKSGDDRLQIEFVTPVTQRILRSGTLSGQLDFFSLAKKITERIELLASLHAEPPQRIDYRGVWQAVKDVSISGRSFQYYQYGQKSERQERVVRRDVFLGKISYQGGNLAEYLPIVRAGEILNVGADTTHGFGRFVVTETLG